MSGKRIVRVPITGWYGEERRKYKREILKSENLTLDSIIADRFHASIQRSLKSWLVELLAHIRDNGGATRCPAGIQAVEHYAEWEGLTVPVELYKPDPLYCDLIFRLTPAGMEFLRKHEAPEEWQAA